MELSLIEIKQLGLKAKGEIGDSDPNVAIEDALRVFPADEIVISTHPPIARAGWSTVSSTRPASGSTCRSPTWSSTSPADRAHCCDRFVCGFGHT